MKHFKANMALMLEKSLVKLHLRAKKCVSQGRSKVVSEESSNKDGGASEEDGEHRNEEPRPPTVLARGMVKLHLRRKESVSEGPSKELFPEESSKDGGASEEIGEHCGKPRTPNVLEKGLVKLHLRPKELVSEGLSNEPVSEGVSKDGGVSEENDEDCTEPCQPNLLEKGLVKLHLRPKERVSEGRTKELVLEESSRDGGASEEKGERCSEPRPPQVRILNETDPTVFFHGLLERAKEAILPVRLVLTVLEAESGIEYYDLMLLRKMTPNIPVNSECPECKVVRIIVYKQRIYARGIRFDKGEHTVKVAWILPGNLTPSSRTCLGAITYEFRALVNTTRDEEIYSEWQPLLIKRDTRPLPQRSLHSVFPTPRSAVVTVATIPQIVYPTGEFPVHLRLTNLKTPERDISGKLCHWRWWLHKVSWTIIEQTKWVSNGCLEHTPGNNLFRRLGPSVGDEDFDMRTTYEDRRDIGSGAFHEGWSTDFAYAGFGKIDFDFTVSMNLACAPVCSFRTLDEEYSVQHFLSIEMRLEDDMTGDLIGPVIPAQRLRVISQLVIEEESAKSVNWDEADPIIADADADADADEQSAAAPSVRASISAERVSPQTDIENGEEKKKKQGGDSWFVPGEPDERGRPTYDFVGKGSRGQSIVGRQQVPQLELEKGAGGRGGVVDDDEERLRPIIPDS